MIYTVSQGLDTKREKLQSYLFRGLPIAIATLIAVVGAFAPIADQNRQKNGRPLAIYTATSSDFGAASNPQGNGTDTQSNDSDKDTSPASDAAGSSTASSPSPESSSGGSAGQPLVGGRGGDSGSGDDSGGCLCESLPELPLDPQTLLNEDPPSLPENPL